MARRAFALAVALATIAAPGWAQDTSGVDPRWAPYLGCWQLQRQSTGDLIADMVAVAARQAKAGESREDVMICVTAAPEPSAVSQQTVLNGESVLDEIVAADGRPRTGEDQSCRSTRQAQWSASGRQLFTRGTVACEGQPERTITGLSLVMRGPTWIDVQMVEARGSRSVRVRRYGLSREQQRLARATTPDGPEPMDRWTLDEVKEAARHVAPEVLQAALVEVGAKLPLSARRLVELDAAGVPGPVVDVMVALSFPEKFVIDKPTGSNYGGGYTGGWGGFGGPLDPWLVGSDLAWLSLYAPFGYQYYGYYDPRYGPGWGNWVGVVPPIAGSPVPEDANGRVVNGLGYTRVRPRDPEPRISGSYVDRSGTSGTGTSGGGTGDSNGGGSGVTSGGYTSGSGGASGGSGRTAVPRPPGGGNR